MSKLLIDESPLVISPFLASSIGLNNAVMLQHLHDCLDSESAYIRDGRQWCRRPIVQLCKELPFWSEPTIKRAIYSLRKLGLLEFADHHNGRSHTINYEVLLAIEDKANQK